MTNSQQYLDACRAALGVPSDYALARCLSMTQQAVSKLRQGKTTLGDRTALRVAAILEIAPERVIADAHAERERDPDLRALWHSISDNFSALEPLLRPTPSR